MLSKSIFVTWGNVLGILKTHNDPHRNLILFHRYHQQGKPCRLQLVSWAEDLGWSIHSRRSLSMGSESLFQEKSEDCVARWVSRLEGMPTKPNALLTEKQFSFTAADLGRCLAPSIQMPKAVTSIFSINTQCLDGIVSSTTWSTRTPQKARKLRAYQSMPFGLFFTLILWSETSKTVHRFSPVKAFSSCSWTRNRKFGTSCFSISTHASSEDCRWSIASRCCSSWVSPPLVVTTAPRDWVKICWRSCSIFVSSAWFISGRGKRSDSSQLDSLSTSLRKMQLFPRTSSAITAEIRFRRRLAMTTKTTRKATLSLRRIIECMHTPTRSCRFHCWLCSPSCSIAFPTSRLVSSHATQFDKRCEVASRRGK